MKSDAIERVKIWVEYAGRFIAWLIECYSNFPALPGSEKIENPSNDDEVSVNG